MAQTSGNLKRYVLGRNAYVFETKRLKGRNTCGSHVGWLKSHVILSVTSFGRNAYGFEGERLKGRNTCGSHVGWLKPGSSIRLIVDTFIESSLEG